jgi:integrase
MKRKFTDKVVKAIKSAPPSKRTEKRKFTDKFVKGIKAAPSGKRVEYYDTMVSCFGMRVTDRGHKTYILHLKWPGSTIATRREVGNATDLPLADAREKAQAWRTLVALGTDPREKQRAAEAEARQRRQHTFEVVAEAWFLKIKHQRKADEVERDVRREFVERWRGRPVTSITRQEIAQIIEDKAMGLAPAPKARKKGPAPAQARNLLGHVKSLFLWAVASGKYGLEVSPAQPVQGRAIYGKKRRRSRVLKEDELRQVWSAVDQLEYPYGPCIKLLILSGQRKSEVAEAVWPEFDLRKKLWIIPKERMKMDHDHLVPLTEDMLALLADLPRFNTGLHLFSTTFGERPANGWSKCKERINEITGPLPHWVIHDLRRTMRTNLSAIPQISDRVREVMIAHNGGMHAVYDLYDYSDEKRQGFGLWNARLAGILAAEPAESNVVPLRG